MAQRHSASDFGVKAAAYRLHIHLLIFNGLHWASKRIRYDGQHHDDVNAWEFSWHTTSAEMHVTHVPGDFLTQGMQTSVEHTLTRNVHD